MIRRIISDYPIDSPITDERPVRLQSSAGKIPLDGRHDPRPGLTGERLVVIIPIPIADGGDR